MFLLPFALALAPVLSAGQAQTGTPAQTGEVAADHTGLMPEVPVVLRLESLDSAYASFLRLGELGDAVGDAPSKEDFLRELLSVPVSGADLDPSRPIYIGTAVSMGPPMITAVLPVRDAAAVQASGEAAGATVALRGDWAGVSLAPGYAPGASNSVLAAMEPGVASVHVDLETLLEMFGPFIEMGLAQIETTDMPTPEETGGMDVELMMELYLDGFRTFMDCAESLDLGLQEGDGELAFHMAYTALDGSELANLFEPRPLPATLPAPFDPDAQMVYMMFADWPQVWEVVQPWVEDFIEVYPAEFAGGMGSYMEIVMKAYALMGDTAVGYGNFGAGGMNGVFFAEAADAGALTAEINAAMTAAEAAFGPMGMGFDAAQTVEIGGVTAVQRGLNLDYDKLLEMFGGAAAYGGDAPDMEELRQMMAALYGEHPMITMAHTAGRVCLMLSNDPALVAPGLAGLTAEPVSAATLLSGLSGLPAQAHPLIVYRMELVGLMNAMRPMMGAAGEELRELPDQPLDLTTWMAASGRRWLGGVKLNSADLKGFIEAMKKAR